VPLDIVNAGMAAIAGALFIVLVPVKNDLFLAASLAFAGGVMLYIRCVALNISRARPRGVLGVTRAEQEHAGGFCQRVRHGRPRTDPPDAADIRSRPQL
jgi:hypothetical protein